MSSPESKSYSTTSTGTVGHVNSPTRTVSPAVGAARNGAFALGAGLLAAVASWGIGEAFVEHYRPRTHVVQGAGGPMTIASPEELMATQAKNATLAYGLMGGALGLLLGLAGGLARSTVRSAAGAGVVGMALGAAAGAGATLAMVPLYHRFQDARQEMASMDITVPLLIHSAIWAAAGAAAGLAFGLGAREGRRRLLKAALGGLVGAMVGAAVYELVGALAFPLDKTVEPISLTWTSRLLAHSAVCLFAAIGITLSLSAGERTARGRDG